MRKDVFRAPGHQGNMKKLIHFLQTGHLVNMDNFSVYTIASVLKKFLRKIPGGVFGKGGEQQLFTIIQIDSIEQQRDQIHKLITSLPIHAQRLLVLLFGTFRVIAVNSEKAHTGMSSEAIGVSVAPSFFQTCVSGGKTAKMEDVLKFKVATRVVKFMIDNFGVSNLFGKNNYEFYARITGRILKVEEDWIFSFRYPPDTLVSRQLSFEAEKTWLQHECERWGLKLNLESLSRQEESQSTPALIHIPESLNLAASLGMIPENTLLENYVRLSMSLEESGLLQVSGRSTNDKNYVRHSEITLDELRVINRYAESTKSLSYLPLVHERQTARMRSRSEWFLMPINDGLPGTNNATTIHMLHGSNRSSSGHEIAVRSGSVESIRPMNLRRIGSKDKSYFQRHSPGNSKENGAKSNIFETHKSQSQEIMKTRNVRVITDKAEIILNTSREILEQRESIDHLSVCTSDGNVGPKDCTEMDVQTFHVTLTYKPRI